MPTTAHTFPLFWIPLLPAIGAAVCLIFGRYLSRRAVHAVACTAVGAACVVSLYAILGHLWGMWSATRGAGGASAVDPEVRYLWFTWIKSGPLSIDMAFLLDPLSAVMIFTITFVGTLIHVYSTGYMAHDKRYAAYFGYLNLFTAAMLILVLGDSLPVMFIGWEGVGLCSYLLIGFWFDKDKNANAGRKAFIVNRIGDFGFLLGIFLLYSTTKKLDYAGLEGAIKVLAAPFASSGMPLAFWAGLLLFVGACGKSAQIPLYVWLPDAMAGPTPVSALIHAATMVTAGVYMIARLGFLYLQAPEIMMIVAGVGTLTALVAAAIGFAQTDIKKVLAYSTVSQLGFMFAAVGCGAFGAGIFHLFTHAFFKAGLFLAAGSVMHAMGDRTEIMEMGGLRKKIPVTHATFLIYCLAIAGIFPFAGFFSKDEILLSAYAAHLQYWPSWYGGLIWICLSVAALGTAFYMWRLYFLVFGGESRADAETQRHIHESPSSMTMPLVILAGGAMVLGLLGLPHIFKVGNFMHAWLGGTFGRWPVSVAGVHVSAGLEIGLMAFSLLLGLAGIFAAWLLYANGPSERARGLVAAIAPLQKVVANKFYVDELYDLIIVRPFRWLATATYNVIDRFVIDLLLVNGSAFVTEVIGRLTRWWQNGDVQRYMAAMVVGAVAIFWLTGRSEPGFKWTTTGNAADGWSVSFEAEVGAGPSGQGNKFRWDLDGDGKPDAGAEGPTVTKRFTTAGAHKVALIVEDGIYHKQRRVERTLTVGEVKK